MTIRPLSRAELREVDRRAIDEFGMSGLVLMENAGRGCAEVLWLLGSWFETADASRLPGGTVQRTPNQATVSRPPLPGGPTIGPVVIVCGKGNNAGDGFVIARHLDMRRIAVKVVLLSPPEELRGDAAANYKIIDRMNLPLVDLSRDFSDAAMAKELAGARWAVDAILGTGATGSPRSPFDSAIRQMNAAPVIRLAVDLPSGLDCDTGEPAEPTFRADQTCTFVAPKIGFLNPHAAPYLGQLHVLDIGAPRKLVEEISSSH